MITVFTPTYNRAKNLQVCYDSLREQSCKDFEWLIVDDGSTDNTSEVVQSFIEDAKGTESFPIRYIKKENGGKHTAINRGVQEAKGELFLILDSDDSLPPQAIQIIVEKYDLVRNRPDCGGVCGLMAHYNGVQIGNGFPHEELYTDSIKLRFRYGVEGDLMEVFKTSIMREYPFPEIKEERFCPEQLVWFRIAQKYKLYCFNKVVYYRDYLEGGLTEKIVKVRMNSPIASMVTYAELTRYDVPFKEKLKAAINYYRFKACYRRTDNIVRIAPIWLIAYPLGMLMHIKDVKTVGSK